jgi:uncharacterized protein
VGCRGKASKRNLLRLVRAHDGAVAVDPSGSAPGRGAYVHRRAGCADAAMRKGALARALRTRLDPDGAARLRADMQADIEREAGR